MPKKGTTLEQFLEKAKKKYGDTYEYVGEYTGYQKKMKMKCKKHGIFEQSPRNHLRSKGCPLCYGTQKKTYKKYVKELQEQHGEKITVKEKDYKGLQEKVKANCKLHGDFEIYSYNLLRGHGCQECGKEASIDKNTKSHDTFLSEARDAHGDKYNYIEEYKTAHEKIKIECPEHGIFEQAPNNHIRGMGCPKCNSDKLADLLSLDQADVIKRFKDVHGDKYDYSLVKYKNQVTKVQIICPEHGEFKQQPSAHFHGQGCPTCGKLSSIEKQTKTIDDFKARVKEKWGDKFDLSKTKYVNVKTKVKLACPDHGEFERTVSNLFKSEQGCPKCGIGRSKAEKEIESLILSWGLKCITSDRSILLNRELDLVIPEKKIAIEYNGLFFHREGLIKVGSYSINKDKNYHLQKTLESKDSGYRLIQIFEDEWVNNQELVISKLKHILGVSDAEKIYARKCKIKKITYRESSDFLDINHIQGSDKAGIRYGAFHGDILVGVMTFLSTPQEGEYKLNRYATDINLRCIGLASKLLKHFERMHQPSKIITYADRRWTLNYENNLYTAIGFKHVGYTQPGYGYFDTETMEPVRHSRQKFMKHKLLKANHMFNKDMTEKEMAAMLGYDRVWDCGNHKFELEYAS